MTSWRHSQYVAAVQAMCGCLEREFSATQAWWELHGNSSVVCCMSPTQQGFFSLEASESSFHVYFRLTWRRDAFASVRPFVCTKWVKRLVLLVIITSAYCPIGASRQFPRSNHRSRTNQFRTAKPRLQTNDENVAVTCRSKAAEQSTVCLKKHPRHF